VAVRQLEEFKDVNMWLNNEIYTDELGDPSNFG
jgi:hypothetical protein